MDCTPDAHIFRNPVVPKKPGVFACGGRPRSTRDPGRTGEIIELPLYLVEIRIHDFRPLSVRAVLTALASGRSTALGIPEKLDFRQKLRQSAGLTNRCSLTWIATTIKYRRYADAEGGGGSFRREARLARDKAAAQGNGPRRVTK